MLKIRSTKRHRHLKRSVRIAACAALVLLARTNVQSKVLEGESPASVPAPLLRPQLANGVVEAPEPPARMSVPRERPEKEVPFWRRKPEWRRRLMEERAVVVSVSHDKVKSAAGEEIKFTIKGAGLISAPKGFSFRTAQQYSKLKNVSSHFRTVEFHEPSRKLHLVLQALGYQARMVLKMQTVSEDWRDEIQWEVIWGDFKGMTGVIAFEPAGSGRTEASIESVYQAQKLPLPKILMGLALEAVAQKVAGEMRVFIENEFRSVPVAEKAK